MVSDKIMKEFLAAIPAKPISQQDLFKKLDRDSGNCRRVLGIMEELGIVEKVQINEPGRRGNPRTVGWKRRGSI